MRRAELTCHYDLAVLGSGFAGSLMAMIARQSGLSVVLLEKGQHPRVVIGESSTPLSNLLLETLAEQYDLPWLRSFTKWGSWQSVHPEIACGLKRGFTFFHHELGRESPAHRNPVNRQLLVAASPHDTIADTHWFREHFDEFLVQQARDMGVVYLDRCDVREARREDGQWCLQGVAGDGSFQLGVTFLVDATGPRGLLHRLLGLGDAGLPALPATSALYSHFTGVLPFQGAQHYIDGEPPYPPDAAALHHVFDGGWMWVLRFNNGWTSAGVVADAATANRFGFAEERAAWDRLLCQLPEVQQQFATAQQVTPFTYAQQLSFRSSEIVGEGWALLPSAAGFVDPLLSTGFPLTLLGITRLGEMLSRDWATSRMETSLARYSEQTDRELVATADLIGALYANMGDFATFRSLSLLYFAAASYAETVRRLGKAELAPSFLLHDHPVFGPKMRSLTERSRQPLEVAERAALHQQILALVQEFDVAGLTKEPSDHCYPVCAEDLFAGAEKVGASQAELEAMLQRAGFQTPVATLVAAHRQ